MLFSQNPDSTFCKNVNTREKRMKPISDLHFFIWNRPASAHKKLISGIFFLPFQLFIPLTVNGYRRRAKEPYKKLIFLQFWGKKLILILLPLLLISRKNYFCRKKQVEQFQCSKVSQSTDRQSVAEAQYSQGVDNMFIVDSIHRLLLYSIVSN